MVDEVITMFLAGSFTLRTANSNMIQYLALYPKTYHRLVAEIKATML
jgi:cytochrome P450